MYLDSIHHLSPSLASSIIPTASSSQFQVFHIYEFWFSYVLIYWVPLVLSTNWWSRNELQKQREFISSQDPKEKWLSLPLPTEGYLVVKPKWNFQANKMHFKSIWARMTRTKYAINKNNGLYFHSEEQKIIIDISDNAF